MSNVIPKEHLTAYQRWELASLGEDKPDPQKSAAAAREAERQAEEERARLREEAQQQGYAEGFNQGHAAGLETGRKEAAQEAKRMQEIADTFSTEIERAGETMADDMLDLALDLAKAMLKSALKIRPELVLPIVGDAIRYLPAVQQPALLALHPEDAAIVRNHIKDELEKAGWRITEDLQMERGGCRIETASNQIDASPQVRWQRITEALGKQSDWLE